VPNFVDAGHYRPQYAPGRDFVYFGRVSREKGLATLIRATAAARGRLIVIGTGPDLEGMRRLAAELAADVAFPGFLSGEALHEMVRGARAVVLPSEWYENAPMSVLEAYALGKPVIGARIGGIPELIRENETGFGFASGDVAALTAVLSDTRARADAEIEAMGRRARGWVEVEFTPDAYRARILEVYRDLGVGLSHEPTRVDARVSRSSKPA
jgi:glycosyltransferase involved in cell wall biosynthesis